MRLGTFLCIGFVVCQLGLCRVDDVQEALAIAKVRHAERLTAAAEKVKTAYREKIAEATQKGDTVKSQEYLSHLKAFEEQGAILGRPELAVTFQEYGKELKAAGDDLHKAWSAAMDVRLKEGKTEEFAKLQSELLALRLPGTLTSVMQYGTRNYWMHGDYLIVCTTSRGIGPQLNGTYEVVNGLWEPNAVSFRSVNWPDHYLVHGGFRMRLQKFVDDPEYRKNATFVRRPGLVGAKSGSSYESVNYQGRFIRARDNHELWLDAREDNGRYNAQATFDERKPLFQLW